MKTNELLEKDEFGIFADDNLKGIPYVGFKLTEEQMKKIESKKLCWYDVVGRKFFEIRGEDGNFTNEYMMFVLFVD